MPNYVKNRIIIDPSLPKESFQKFLAAVATPCPVKDSNLPIPAEDAKEATCFDFNAILPMPKDLSLESGTSSDMAMALVDFREQWPVLLREYVSTRGYTIIYSIIQVAQIIFTDFVRFSGFSDTIVI